MGRYEEALEYHFKALTSEKKSWMPSILTWHNPTTIFDRRTTEHVLATKKPWITTKKPWRSMKKS